MKNVTKILLLFTFAVFLIFNTSCKKRKEKKAFNSSNTFMQDYNSQLSVNSDSSFSFDNLVQTPSLIKYSFTSPSRGYIEINLDPNYSVDFDYSNLWHDSNNQINGVNSITVHDDVSNQAKTYFLDSYTNQYSYGTPLLKLCSFNNGTAVTCIGGSFTSSDGENIEILVFLNV